MSQSSTEFHSDRTPIQEGQLAPHSVEAEEAVLGSVLLNPESIYEVIPFLKTEDFFLVRHGWIWDAMIGLLERDEPVDHLTVVSEMEIGGKLSEAGGAAYIISLINKTPSALNIEGYGRIIERMALRRRLISAAQIIARTAHSDETDIDDVVERSEKALIDATSDRRGTKRQTAAEVHDVPPEEDRFLSTGSNELDWVMDYKFAYGRTLLLLGASGQFKTTLACQMASDLALLGKPVLYVSQEMPAADVKDKMCKYQAFICGSTYANARSGLNQSNLAFVSGRQRVSDIAAHVRAMGLSHHQPGVVFIDTVQKLIDTNGRYGRDQMAVAAASGAIDAMKLDSGWAVVNLAQQYIETNDRNPASLRPSRNNVKDAKALYEDADLAVGVYWADNWRHEYGSKFEDAECLPGHMEIKAIKGRYGNPLKKKLLVVIPGIPALVPTNHAAAKTAIEAANGKSPMAQGELL